MIVDDASQIICTKMEEKDDLCESNSLAPEKSLYIGWRLSIPQVVASFICNCIVINCGISLVFSAVLLPQLMETGSELPISQDDASWIASLVTIATPVGAILTGPCMDRYGRRTGCKICTMVLCSSWLLMALSYSVPMLYFSRLVCGFGAGLSTVVLVYVSEISHTLLRPALLCLNSVFFTLGILLTCLSGSWMSWRSTAFASAAFCALLFCLLWLVPESPYWSAIRSNGREDTQHWANAVSSLRWLYRNELVFNHETECLKRNMKDTKTFKALSLSECVKSLRHRTAFKPLCLLVVLFVFQQLSGAYVLIFYAVHLFKKVGGKIEFGMDALEALIVMGAIRFVMSVIVSVLSRKIGRRPLLMTSFMGMGVTALILGICLYSSVPISESNLFVENKKDGSVLPIVCILLFVAFSSLGVLVIPWTLAVELLPVQIRGLCGGLMVSWAYILMFIIVKCFPYIIHFIGISIMFFFLSIICCLGFLFIYKFLPETFGKSFAEIEKLFV